MQYNSVSDRLYCGGNSMSVIDCASDTIVHTIPVAATVFAFDSSRNKLYAGGSGPLSVIDCERDSVVATISRVDSAGALCFNPTAAKVYTTSGDTLFAVHANADTIVARLGFTGLAPTLACDPQRNRVFCACTGYWSSIDCAVDTVVLSERIYSALSFLACNTSVDRLYILTSSSDGVAVCDATTGQRLASIRLDGIPSGAGLSQGLDRLYCLPMCNTAPVLSQTGLLVVVDCVTDSLDGVVPLTMWARAIGVDTVGNKLYFMNAGAGIGSIGAVDCARNVVTSYTYAGESPGPVCYNPNNRQLYWSTGAYTGENGAVMVFDCVGDTVLKRIPVDGGVPDSSTSPRSEQALRGSLRSHAAPGGHLRNRLQG